MQTLSDTSTVEQSLSLVLRDRRSLHFFLMKLIVAAGSGDPGPLVMLQ